jgi:hypothetical protein
MNPLPMIHWWRLRMVIYPGDIPKPVLRRVCHGMLQGARAYRGVPFRSAIGGKRIKGGTSRPIGHTPDSAKRQQTAQGSIRECRGRLRLPGCVKTCDKPAPISNLVTVPPLGHPKDYPGPL